MMSSLMTLNLKNDDLCQNNSVHNHIKAMAIRLNTHDSANGMAFLVLPTRKCPRKV